MKLYGGAVELAVPPGFLDASKIRQVPDNQEVFLSTASDDSIVVELLEMDDSYTIEDYFRQLAEDNEAGRYSIISSTFTVAFGVQEIAKFDRVEADTVSVALGLIRLKEYNADALISWNRPGTGPPADSDMQRLLESFTVIDSGLFGS